VEVIVPSPVKRCDLVTVNGNVCSVNVAVTDLGAFIWTVQVAPDTESQPLQLVRSDPVAGVAVSVTTVPTS